MYKDIFLPLAKDLIKTRGICHAPYIENCKVEGCSTCYFYEVKKGIPCNFSNSYEFALKFIRENNTKQMGFIFK